MLIDKYLPKYDFREFHSIKVISHTDNVYQQVLNCDLSQSWVIKLLFRIRGIPAGFSSIEDILRMGFIKLDEVPGEEIIFGMITNSPVFNGCRTITSGSEFISRGEPDILKAVINFRVTEDLLSQFTISTETRVWCGSAGIKKRFRLYWLFVKPFSQIVRKEILKQVKKQLRSAGNL